MFFTPNVRESRPRETVVLVHGLWMRAPVMIPMKRRLERCGYSAHAFSYSSLGCNLRQNAELLARYVDSLGAETVHIVAHSLGGLVALSAAEHLTSGRGRYVLLGTPFVDCYSGRRLHRSRPGRWLLGRCMAEWLEKSPRVDVDGMQIGVIAGNGGIGMGRLIARGLPKPHDGVVTVDETLIPHMRDHTVLPVSHSAMLFAPAVIREICAFLRNGHFESGASSG
jgi:pimeloyl-ACP methyl ester carboxylesterase